jgi:ergothioneine biosynthesis protein EgtB
VPVRDALSPQTRQALVDRYQRNRRRSAALFDLVDDASYYSKPIDLRHPIVFYEGHLPAFSFNTLVKRGLGGASIDEKLEALFARGIDPAFADAPAGNPHDPQAGWPTRAEVKAFAAEADARVIDALEKGDIEQPGHPLLDRAEAAFAILEHEAMHQETLLYMWHRLPLTAKRAPDGYAPPADGATPLQFDITVPAGRASLGVESDDVEFSWDNERPRSSAMVEEFTIDAHNVTNEAFLAFVEAGGYRNHEYWTDEDFGWLVEHRIERPLFWEDHGGQLMWRGMFELIALPMSWPVYVSHAEASAFARWRGRRLPTEAEFQRAAYGAPAGEDRRFPWGSADADATRGVFDFETWDPAPAGSRPAGVSAWAIHDLVGNGWEWTSTVFAPFEGFTALPSYPEYSADFFDGEHFVMKGASPATARELIRPSFRNWFRARYPYVYAAFRTVANG